mmetsp:Transcript_27730/g.82770  ORF Transcript_27730/g.82770 Transcript_27730/m.82770 type:complete len:158 (-) Transcript_27730:192-665(-)
MAGSHDTLQAEPSVRVARNLRGCRACCGGDDSGKGEFMSWKVLEHSAALIGTLVRSGFGFLGGSPLEYQAAHPDEWSAEKRAVSLEFELFLSKTGGSSGSLLEPGTYKVDSDEEDATTGIPAAAHWKERMACPRIGVTVPTLRTELCYEGSAGNPCD